jgi:nicotinamidase-related amidase
MINPLHLCGLLLGLVCFSFAQNDRQSQTAGEPLRPALLVIDTQNEYLPSMDEDEKKYALHVINGALWFFHGHNLPVIRVYHSDLRWGPAEASEAFKYPKEINIRETDTFVHKHYPSAFTGTDLDKILKKKKVNTLFLTGLSATHCVLATYFGGIDREYKTFLVREGILSHRAEYTDVIKDVCEAVSLETMMFMIEKSK